MTNDEILKLAGESVGQGLIDDEGKCYTVGRHKSSICIGGRSFKSQPLFTADQVIATVNQVLMKYDNLEPVAYVVNAEVRWNTDMIPAFASLYLLGGVNDSNQ